MANIRTSTPITIKDFDLDDEANEFFNSYKIPRKHNGIRVVGCELQYGCKANNFAKTKVVLWLDNQK